MSRKQLHLRLLVWSVLREYGTLQQVRFVEKGYINPSIRRISLLHDSKAVDLEKKSSDDTLLKIDLQPSNIYGLYLRTMFSPVTIRYSRNPGLEFLRSAASSVSISEERRLNATHHFVKLRSEIASRVYVPQS